MRRRAGAAVGFLLLAVLGAAGCDGDHTLVLAPRTFIPPAGSPEATLRLLERSFNEHSTSLYRELFAADFEFTCGSDSSGADWTERPARIAPAPSANVHDLALDRGFLVYPDPDYLPQDPEGRLHRTTRTTVTFRYMASDGSEFEVRGYATFSLVRGNIAAIPDELRARGTGPDPTRWYIRRWNDESCLTIPGGSRTPEPQPSQSSIWCAPKRLYR